MWMFDSQISQGRFLLVFYLKKLTYKHLSLECRKVKIWRFGTNGIMIHWRTSTDHGSVWTTPSASSTHWRGPCISLFFVWRVLTWCSQTPRGPPVSLRDPPVLWKGIQFIYLCLCAFFWGESLWLSLDLGPMKVSPVAWSPEMRWSMKVNPLACSLLGPSSWAALIPEQSSLHHPPQKRLFWFSRKVGLGAGHGGGRKRLYSPKTQRMNQRPRSLEKKSQSNNQNKDCKKKDKLNFLRPSLPPPPSSPHMQLPLSLQRVWALASPECRQEKHF